MRRRFPREAVFPEHGGEEPSPAWSDLAPPRDPLLYAGKCR